MPHYDYCITPKVTGTKPWRVSLMFKAGEAGVLLTRIGYQSSGMHAETLRGAVQKKYSGPAGGTMQTDLVAEWLLPFALHPPSRRYRAFMPHYNYCITPKATGPNRGG